MSTTGQEGDTRPYRKLRRADYYEAKAAADADHVTEWPKCKTCGEAIRGHNWNGYCMRCHRET
jgi:ribosomal protein L32